MIFDRPRLCALAAVPFDEDLDGLRAWVAKMRKQMLEPNPPKGGAPKTKKGGAPKIKKGGAPRTK